ncbi:MAG: DUF6491 family protein [Alphaproteobacteria bacterium]|nr:DUF6491 family protein [Alphaproteobacteria bacterium]
MREANIVRGMKAFSFATAGTLCATALQPASAAEPLSPGCALVSSIDSWQEVDEETAIIEASPRRKFRVTFTSPCREMNASIFAHIELRRSAGRCLSPGDTIIFGRGQSRAFEHYEFEERCTIKSIEPAIPGGPEIPLLPRK